MLFAIMLVMAGVPHSRTFPQDDPAAKVKRDTSTMDSLELAIYKHNKAVDDSLRLDSINRSKKNGIDSPVQYVANDSLTYSAASGLAHLYGSSNVKYQNMDLSADHIYMSLDSNLVHADSRLDSTTNQPVGSPVFKMGSDTYETGEMAFNFKTKKGIIEDVYTQQEDGYLTSELSKRGANGEMFLQHGRYTTCDDPHPDFYLAMSRAKVRPGKDVVFGPSYLVVADVPLPLAIPYGFFPFTKSYSSGFIMPTYGDETEKGFYLRDGGYYFAVSDKMDLKLIGEIYTKGSWGLSAASNYKKRYRYSGSFLFSYQNSVTGEKNMPDYSRQTSYKLTWSHRQDAKANPYSNLSASVNFASSSYERNNLTSMYNPQSLTQTTRASSVNFSTTFSSIGMSISSGMTLNQNMRDSTIDFSAPDLTISIAQFHPFKRKRAAGAERWYEKITMRYTGNLKNSIHAKEDQILHSSLSKDWKNGMQHSIPINATFSVLKYLNVTPQISFTDRTLLTKVKRSWDENSQQEVRDTIGGFYNVFDWRGGIEMNTTMYGFFIPNRKVFGEKIQAIRHVVKPSVSFNYAPDFSSGRYGYYDTYMKTNADGSVEEVKYSLFQNGAYSAPSGGKTGSLSMNLSNNVEMKMKSDDDSIGYKKISLIDEFRLGIDYNFAAEKTKWSDLSASLRLKLSKSYTLNLSTTFHSYVYELDSNGKPVLSTDRTYWSKGTLLGPFRQLTQNLTYQLNNEKVINLIKRLKGEKVDKKNKKKEEEEDEDDYGLEPNIDKDMEKAKRATRNQGSSKAETDEDGYMLCKLPFSLNINYGFSIREDTRTEKFNYDSMRYPYTVSQTLGVGGSLGISDGWNLTFNSGYDFDNKKISMTSVGLNRDLHCFNMSCQVVLAPYTSYNFSFRCNASTLTDALKYDKRSGSSNAVQWY